MLPEGVVVVSSPVPAGNRRGGADRRRSGRGKGLPPPPVRVDWGHVAKGASAGFTALFIGGWLAPIVQGRVPSLGVLCLVVVGLVGFALAGRQIGVADLPAAQGALAALASYLLMVPVIVITSGWVGAVLLLAPCAGAAAVGAVSGYVAGRARPERTGAVRR